MGYALAAATVLSSARAARAGDASVVIVEADDVPAAEAETIDAIRAQVGDLPVDVIIERHARFADLRAQMDYAHRIAAVHDARGVLWVDTDVSGDTLLFLFDPDGPRLLLRRVKHEGEREAVTEEVADVAHGIIDALAQGRHVGMSVLPVAHEPARPPRPRVVHAEPRERAAWSVAFGGGFAAESWSSRSPWSAGTALFAEARTRGGALFRAEYTFFEPFTALATNATIRLARHPVDVAVGWEARPGSFALGAERGATLDPGERSTTFVADGSAAPSRVAWTFALSPRLRVGWHPLPWLDVYARAGADVFLAQANYAIGNAAVFSPDVARLRVDVGLAFTAWGRR